MVSPGGARTMLAVMVAFTLFVGGVIFYLSMLFPNPDSPKFGTWITLSPSVNLTGLTMGFFRTCWRRPGYDWTCSNPALTSQAGYFDELTKSGYAYPTILKPPVGILGGPIVAGAVLITLAWYGVIWWFLLEFRGRGYMFIPRSSCYFFLACAVFGTVICTFTAVVVHLWFRLATKAFNNLNRDVLGDSIAEVGKGPMFLYISQGCVIASAIVFLLRPREVTTEVWESITPADRKWFKRNLPAGPKPAVSARGSAGTGPASSVRGSAGTGPAVSARESAGTGPAGSIRGSVGTGSAGSIWESAMSATDPDTHGEPVRSKGDRFGAGPPDDVDRGYGWNDRFERS